MSKIQSVPKFKSGEFYDIAQTQFREIHEMFEVPFRKPVFLSDFSDMAVRKTFAHYWYPRRVPNVSISNFKSSKGDEMVPRRVDSKLVRSLDNLDFNSMIDICVIADEYIDDPIAWTGKVEMSRLGEIFSVLHDMYKHMEGLGKARDGLCFAYIKGGLGGPNGEFATFSAIMDT